MGTRHARLHGVATRGQARAEAAGRSQEHAATPCHTPGRRPCSVLANAPAHQVAAEDRGMSVSFACESGRSAKGLAEGQKTLDRRAQTSVPVLGSPPGTCSGPWLTPHGSHHPPCCPVRSFRSFHAPRQASNRNDMQVPGQRRLHGKTSRAWHSL